MDKFLGSNINNKRESPMKDLVDEEFENEKVQSEDNMNREHEISVDHEQENLEEIEKCVPLHFDIIDQGNWKTIDQSLIDLIVKRGPLRQDGFIFPKDLENRHFSSTYYIQHLTNGEKSGRKWLVYSISLDKVFCFCCKLFKQEGNNIQLANEEINDWKNLSFSLKSHETSNGHMHNTRRWVELERRLQ
ncbi:zinc finger MYM-type protein 5-like [Olea europaea var. sylvestris]|uniref:zinc finger MYM-type protein 5-like n=1 Tax=Olea europaea var. sylvestris TaxID=158386 RepID=UPI000C1D2B2D|nr:zinc finger MYM-type protein 5-like [Olea europaea var. sylvestris]